MPRARAQRRAAGSDSSPIAAQPASRAKPGRNAADSRQPRAEAITQPPASQASASRTLAQRIVRAPAPGVEIPADASPRFIAALQAQFGPVRFERYANDRLAAFFSPHSLRVVLSSRALADLYKRRFMTELHLAAEKTLGRGIAIQVESDESGTVFPPPSPSAAQPSAAPGADTNPAAHPHASAHRAHAAQPLHRADSNPASSAIVLSPAERGIATVGEPLARTGSGASGAGRQSPGIRYRLEDFIVGPSNRLAYNAAQRLADGDSGFPGAATSHAAPLGAGSYSLLFIHGPCGVGKSHLAQGAAARFRERHPGAVVRVTSGDAFMTEFVTAIRDGSGSNSSSTGIDRFRRHYRKTDLLCIDDVQALANKQATQAELLHTFEEIARSGARVVLVSDQHPRQLEKFSPQLVSRFLAGMVAGISPPDEELTRRLIKTLALRRGLVLDDNAVNAVASRARLMPGAATGLSVREIEGILTRIEAVHRLLPDHSGAGDSWAGSGAINLLTIERALGSSTSGPHADGHALRAPGAGATVSAAGAGGMGGRLIRVETIITQTCRYLSVDPSDLSARTRHKRVVLARAVITHLARQFTTMSFPEIARAIGRPNHSTVITAYQRLAGQLAAQEILTHEHVPEPMSVNALVERLANAVRHAH
jgi:chromosomal replication initiator protein